MLVALVLAAKRLNCLPCLVCVLGTGRWLPKSRDGSNRLSHQTIKRVYAIFTGKTTVLLVLYANAYHRAQRNGDNFKTNTPITLNLLIALA